MLSKEQDKALRIECVIESSKEIWTVCQKVYLVSIYF